MSEAQSISDLVAYAHDEQILQVTQNIAQFLCGS